MSRLDDAQQKLTAAVERLEAAYKTRQGAAESSGAVQVELAELKAEHDTLRETATTVAADLDATIERIEKLLAG